MEEADSMGDDIGDEHTNTLSFTDHYGELSKKQINEFKSIFSPFKGEDASNLNQEQDIMATAPLPTDEEPV